jgi:GDP-L-fucose synthase
LLKNEVLRSFSGSNVLVTGGTGLIGREITRILCDAGAKVRIVSLDRIEVDNRASHIIGDLTDFTLCKELARDTDFVFHVAGIKGSIEVTKAKPASFFVPLLMFNTNVLEACRLNKVRKVVYTSSIGAWPRCRSRPIACSTEQITSQSSGHAMCTARATTSIRRTPW